jgi:hypothetical protein
MKVITESKLWQVCKLYVKFMVENPEHFKFIFMTDHHNPIIIKNGNFIETDRWTVSLLKDLFIGLRKNEGTDESDWSVDALTIWSLIHGFTTILVNNTIAYEGDYLAAVTLMLEEKVKGTPQQQPQQAHMKVSLPGVTRRKHQSRSISLL